jgi:hypothetical protein
MHPGIRAVRFLGLALVFCLPPAVRAEFVTQTQTQYAFTDPTDSSNHLLPTNWDTASTSFSGLQTPVINQYSGDPSKLNHIDITVDYSFKNLYSITFGMPSTASVSAVDSNHPDQAPQIGVGAGWPLASFVPSLQMAPNSDQAAGLSRSVTLNPGQPPATYSSSLNPNDPHFIPPYNFSQSFSTTLYPGNPDFQKFLGSGQVDLPIAAQGESRFQSTSGNAAGMVQTLAGATLTVTYATVPGLSGGALVSLGGGADLAAVPEPSSVVLVALGGGGLFLAHRYRRRGGVHGRV